MNEIKIQLIENGMQIGAKDVENFLMIMVLKEKNSKKMHIDRYIYENTPFHSSLLRNGLNKFQFGVIIHKDDLWNLKLLYLNQVH